MESISAWNLSFFSTFDALHSQTFYKCQLRHLIVTCGLRSLTEPGVGGNGFPSVAREASGFAAAQGQLFHLNPAHRGVFFKMRNVVKAALASSHSAKCYGSDGYARTVVLTCLVVGSC